MFEWFVCLFLSVSRYLLFGDRRFYWPRDNTQELNIAEYETWIIRADHRSPVCIALFSACRRRRRRWISHSKTQSILN